MTEPGPDVMREAGTAMAALTAELLQALDDGQRALATFEFDDGEQRTDWAYFPREHAGLPLLAMDVRQQKRAHALIAGALSLPAYARVCSIMALESVLNDIEGRRGDAVRDPGRYFVSVFGTPGAARWGWRLEGHHVCLNFTLLDGALMAVTPLFLGANPADVRHGGYSVLRPCGEEEDAARALLEMLDETQVAATLICDVAPPDFVLTNVPRVPQTSRAGERLGGSPRMLRIVRPAWDAYEPHKDAVSFDAARPLGLAASRMTAAQRSALSALVDVYVERVPEATAKSMRERLGTLDDVHFAWAGFVERREGHYYRLQGGNFLVEYDNTQDGANHVHTVWRDIANDFGEDALRAHLRSSHG